MVEPRFRVQGQSEALVAYSRRYSVMLSEYPSNSLDQRPVKSSNHIQTTHLLEIGGDDYK